MSNPAIDLTHKERQTIESVFNWLGLPESDPPNNGYWEFEVTLQTGRKFVTYMQTWLDANNFAMFVRKLGGEIKQTRCVCDHDYFKAQQRNKQAEPSPAVSNVGSV